MKREIKKKFQPKIIKNSPSIFPKGFVVDKIANDLFELEFIDITPSMDVNIISSFVLNKDVLKDLIIKLKETSEEKIK